ncbi:dynein regulatory complex protein 8-like [Ctenocephalides felis]|uniref:dynein regulatory complex protein 8-like n=1 Tax=Ctenocephalides felis TaxID=7515 RepID=UPI000E6E361D|nr:dynein regulatory complex protein 8-like [Ctenocephalides felis]XP_026481338.1 dynein regulatory complex protein 8-like [Ctenocephalides felis]
MDDEIQEEIPVILANEFDQRVASIFLPFDNYGNKTVSITDLPLIVRGLGCVPTEEELQFIATKCTEREFPNIVHLAHFLPFMFEMILLGRFKPAAPELLLRGFQAIDVENKGYLTPDYLKNLLTTQGEVLSEEEVSEFMRIAVDPSTGNIPFEFCVSKLKFIPKPLTDIYYLAKASMEEKPKTRRYSTYRQSVIQQ